MTTTCSVCGREVATPKPRRGEAVIVSCRGDVRPGQPMHPGIGHDIQIYKTRRSW